MQSLTTKTHAAVIETFTFFSNYDMSQGNAHLYPPHGQDPSVTAYFDNLLQEQLDEMRAAYTKELESREAAYQQREKENLEY